MDDGMIAGEMLFVVKMPAWRGLLSHIIGAERDML
jgi:hypothetical protein